MPLRNLKYRQKVQVLFVPVFVLMALGLLLVYRVAGNSLAAEHQERLRRTAHLTDERLQSTVNEMTKIANLFETNRTLKEYLYISTVLGGDPRPLKDLVKPLTVSLDIDDLDLYDNKGVRIVTVDTLPRNDAVEERLTRLLGTLPHDIMYGFTETSRTLKIIAVSPLHVSNHVVGYVAVGKYIDGKYLKELMDISGNHLFLVNAQKMITPEGKGTPFLYAPQGGKFSANGDTYSILERQLNGIHGEPLGTLVVALSDQDLRASTSKLKLYMIGMLGIAALLSFVMSGLFIKTLVDPLNKITTFTGKVARGELDEDLEVTGKDEVTALAGHFNEMKKQLRVQRDIVNRYTGDLERAVRDRTSELDRVQRQLLQAQKMEAVGQLAGGIAHDFNNFLTAIIGYAGVFQKKLRKEDPLRVVAEQIVATSKRAANMTRGLLTFSKKQAINPEAVDVNEIVAGAERILLRLIGEDIELKTVFPGTNLTVLADSGQMEQVLLNLATNARDAMPQGGCLLIETRSVTLDNAFVRRNAWSRTGTYALITVTDTGTGMDEATRERIFEPFFTTKEVGKGTGLGLAMVYGIIQQHEGFIHVYSEVNVGTTFKIYLPMVADETKGVRTDDDLFPPANGTETILVAEDNDVVRELIHSALEEAGYTVIDAVDGEDAVDKFLKAKDSIQMLVLDVIMPKKNAKAVHEEIKRINPHIKILCITGYAADILMTRGVLDNGINLVQKPISTNDLLRKVRTILDN